MDNINLFSLVDQFSSDEQCLRALEGLRWPNGVTCTRCGDGNVFELPVRHKFKCRPCKHQFTVTSGTIMHDSHLPLRKWFFAIYLMCESKKGMSALQIQRTIDVAYRTAWYLCHRIREAMGNDKFSGPTLCGVVEVDETLVGGRRRGVGSGSRTGKTWVAGAIQRDGQVRLERIPNIRKKTLHGFIKRHVRDETEAIYTDELRSYIGIEDDDTIHRTVNHSAEEWVVGTFTPTASRASGACLSDPSWARSTRSARSIWAATSKNWSGGSTTGTTRTSSETPCGASLRPTISPTRS